MKDKRSIIFIDQYAAMGGGQTVLLAMTASCLAAGWKVTVLSPRGGQLEQSLKDQFGNKISRVHLNETKMSVGKKTPIDLLRLAWATLTFVQHLTLLRKHNLVHVNGPHFFLANFLLSFLHRRKSLYHIHLNHSKIEKKLLSKISAAKMTFVLLANSKFVMNELLKLPDIQNSKVRLLRFGLSETLSNLPLLSTISSEKIPDRAVVIGRISKEKGQDIALAASKQTPELSFHIIGDSDFQSSDFKDELVKDAPKNFIFEGKSQNLSETIRKLKPSISIVPSQWDEPFGLVAVESMALSLYTITSGRGGLAEIATETGCETFNSTSELVENLKSFRARSNEENHSRIAKQHEKSQAIFGWPQFSAKLQAILTEAIN